MDFSKLAKSLNPYTIKKGFSYLKQYGFQEFKVRLSERFEKEEVDYNEWCKNDILTDEERKAQRERIWEYPPLISVVVPIYKTPEVFLRQMIESVTAQTYPHWQLCIADGSGDTAETKRIVDSYLSDKRIKYKILAENLGIADNTNAAMELADGDYIALFDHDDLLSENALYEVADRICKTGAEIVYTDEDKVTSDLSERYQPNFKPDFNLDLLRSNNYICHLLVVKKTLVQEVGGQKKEFDGAQDHEFLIRCVEKAKGIDTGISAFVAAISRDSVPSCTNEKSISLRPFSIISLSLISNVMYSTFHSSCFFAFRTAFSSLFTNWLLPVCPVVSQFKKSFISSDTSSACPPAHKNIFVDSSPNTSSGISLH